MKLFLIGIILTVSAMAQTRENTLPGDCVRIGSSGQCITTAEFDTLDGATSNIQTQLSGKVGTTGDETINGIKTFEGKIIASSTANAFIPCPGMTTVQRDAIATPTAGDCVYNSTLGALNIYNGSAWKAAGGGVNQWATGIAYLTNDVVIESNKLYIALSDHTSGTFATDLVGGDWQLLNAKTDVSTDISGVLPLANGGTNKNITASNGAILYLDTDSVELLNAGTSGQILQTNGASAPSWVNKSISGKAQATTSVTVEELQAPNYQLTSTDTNKHLLETGNPNLLQNPGFEHSTVDTGWSQAVTGTATLTVGSDTSTEIEGAKSVTLACAGGASGGTCTFYQDATTTRALPFVAETYIDTDSASGVQVYSRRNGANSLAVDVTTADPTPISISDIAGTTSSGIAYVITVAASQTINVTADRAKVAIENKVNETGLVTPWQSYTPTFTGFGTVSTSDIKWRQNGSGIEIKGTFTTGTTTATEARLSLPNSYTSSSDIPTLQIAGFGGSNSINENPIPLIEPSVSYLTFGRVLSGEAILAKKNGSSLVSASKVVSIHAIVPISGLSASINTYTSQCQSDIECANEFSAQMGTTSSSHSNENISGWIESTSVSSGAVTVTYKSGLFSVEPNVTVTVDVGVSGNVSNRGVTIYDTTSSGFKYKIRNLSDNDTLYTTHIKVSRASTDYKARRQIVGSFKDIPKTPNQQTKTCYYAFGGASATLASPTECTTGTCVEVVDTCGTGSPPARTAEGVYTDLTWANGTWANSSAVKCDCVSFDVTTGTARSCDPYFITSDQTWSSSSGGGMIVNIQTDDRAAVLRDTYVSVECSGVAP